MTINIESPGVNAGALKAALLAILRDSEAVTTNHTTPALADNSVCITHVTTDGSGQTQDITLPNFTLDGNGANVAKNGTIHTVIVDVQTDPSDVVRVFSATHGGLPSARDAADTVTAVPTADGVVLDFAGACVTFVWRDDIWYWDNTDPDSGTTIAQKTIDLSDAALAVFTLPAATRIDGSLPTSDPHDLGLLYIHPSTFALTVSQG